MMLKRLTTAIIAFLALSAQALGVGSIQLCGNQQFDSLGRPISGGLLYGFAAGTTTPQNFFQDFALTIPFPNPIVLDASGRVPFCFIADGQIKVRLTNSSGVTVFAQDNLLVIGPSSGSGGGGAVDPTTVLATGDWKLRYGTGPLTGFVRANGRTIGSGTSGATERANADTQVLFEYLWNTDPNLVVSTGRGATSIADWTANKTITLPDARGRHVAAMDDMGNAAAGRLTAAGFGTLGTVLGAVGGLETNTLTSPNQLPSHTHVATASGTTSNESANHSHNVSGTTGDDAPDHTHVQLYKQSTVNLTAGAVPSWGGDGSTSTGGASTRHQHGFNVTSGNQSASHNHTFNSVLATSATGASAVFGIMDPTIIMTMYIKL